MKIDVNDRGAKKWGRLMIPEFKDNLEQIYTLNVDHKSADNIARLEGIISLATGKSLQVAIDYNSNGTTYEVSGYILKYYAKEKLLHVIDDRGKERKISFINIENIELTN